MTAGSRKGSGAAPVAALTLALAGLAAYAAVAPRTAHNARLYGSWQECGFWTVIGLFILAGHKFPLPLPVRILIRVAAIAALYGYVKIFGPALYPRGWGS
jgi:hypothetical protein